MRNRKNRRRRFNSPLFVALMGVATYAALLAMLLAVFTPEQVGCKLETLWAAKIDTLHPKTTPKCVVSKQVLYRKKQKEK